MVSSIVQYGKFHIMCSLEPEWDNESMRKNEINSVFHLALTTKSDTPIRFL